MKEWKRKWKLRYYCRFYKTCFQARVFHSLPTSGKSSSFDFGGSGLDFELLVFAGLGFKLRFSGVRFCS